MIDYLDQITGLVPAWKAPVKVVSFEDMIKLWAKATAASKLGIRNMESKCAVFIEFLGHDNMAAVTFAEGRDWRDAMIAEEELAPGTIANHLKLVRALFTYAFDNEHITADHMSRVKYNPGDGESRDDFTPEDRGKILTMAREAEPHIYWLNWLCSFHGCRNAEVADATTHAIELIEGLWVINITIRNRSKEQRLKTPVSTRKIALHQAVIDEGLIGYVQSLPPGPLFPAVKPDGYGRRVGTITPELSGWLRTVVEIKDPRKPFYSHRHTATSFLRNTLDEGIPSSKRTSSAISSATARRAHMAATASTGSRP